MEFVSQLGSSTLDALSYLGSLASLGARAAYYTLVARLRESLCASSAQYRKP